MADITAHLAQWEHNRNFIQEIPYEFSDWVVTATLYAAMHAIEALLTADAAKSRSRHQDRFEILQSEQRYQNIYVNYHVLYNLAHVTRYSADPRRWVPPSQVQTEVISNLLYPIEKSVRKLLEQRKPSVAVAKHTPIRLRGPASPPKAAP